MRTAGAAGCRTATFREAVPTPYCGMYTKESHSAICFSFRPWPCGAAAAARGRGQREGHADATPALASTLHEFAVPVSSCHMQRCAPSRRAALPAAPSHPHLVPQHECGVAAEGEAVHRLRPLDDLHPDDGAAWGEARQGAEPVMRPCQLATARGRARWPAAKHPAALCGGQRQAPRGVHSGPSVCPPTHPCFPSGPGSTPPGWRSG